jgi:hypothetical protein
MIGSTGSCDMSRLVSAALLKADYGKMANVAVEFYN